MPVKPLIVCLAIIWSGSASAAITFSLGNATVAAGSTARISLSASSDQNETLSGFNLATDVGNDGYGSPDGFSNFGVEDSENHFMLEATNPGIGIFAEDAYANAGIGDVVLDSNPQHLMYLTLDAAATMTPGIYYISLVDTPLNSATLSSASATSIDAASFASYAKITVTAVPEPASVAVLGGGLAGIWLTRRVRQRRRRPATSC